MKRLLILQILLVFVNFCYSQSPDWSIIKNHISLVPDDTLEYETPFIQSHYNEGWEDGVFITRDGLHLYSTYLPADLISYVSYAVSNPICPDITLFIQLPLLGIDTVTNPWGCSNILHSDIIYAHRTDTSNQFIWQPSNLANPAYWEGGTHNIQKTDGSLDIFVYSKSDSGGTSLYWMRDTIHNPTGSGVMMPDSVNTSNFSEDNPHIERINDTILVLFLDNHPDGGIYSDIYYCVSYDDGATWSAKQPLSSVNTNNEDIHPHMWSDGYDWWLYYASTDTIDVNQRIAIFRSRLIQVNDFNSWGPRERVIGPGNITNNSGVVVAVGEPTLTKWGDISFVCVIMAIGTNDSTDLFEIDPWYMRKKNPIINSVKNSKMDKFQLIVYPNPVKETMKIRLKTNLNEKYWIKIYDINGKSVYDSKEFNKNEQVINTNHLSKGLYLLKVYNDNFLLTKMFVKQ